MSNQEKEPLELSEQIERRRREISSERLAMSVRELTSMYENKELIIRPEFQRLFRWDDDQKSKLVESILLGIPIPSIFVATTDEGWEVVDGLQRLSTLLQLQGLLPGSDGKPKEALRLRGTKYLPDLEGRIWPGGEQASDQSSIETRELPKSQVFDIKSCRIDVQIIKRESSPAAKYDLFQRLNSYGSMLTAQELRSAMLVAVDPKFLKWIEKLAKSPAFVATVQPSERFIKEQYDIELVLRFLALHDRDPLRQNDLRNFSQFLDDQALALAADSDLDRDFKEEVFTKVFQHIGQSVGDDAFRRWDPAKGTYSGQFLNTSYEAIGIGLGFYIGRNIPHRTDIESIVKEFWTRPEMNRKFATGVSTERRLTQFISVGRELFSPNSVPTINSGSAAG